MRELNLLIVSFNSTTCAPWIGHADSKQPDTIDILVSCAVLSRQLFDCYAANGLMAPKGSPI
jgi:hypothetical protein